MHTCVRRWKAAPMVLISAWSFGCGADASTSRRPSHSNGGAVAMQQPPPAGTQAASGGRAGPLLPPAVSRPPSAGSGGTAGSEVPNASGGAPTCGSVQIHSDVKTTEMVIETPGNVLFVFDQSSSMNEPWNGTPKWSVANSALVAAFTPLQGRLSAGAVLYPTPDTSMPTPTCNWAVDWVACLAGLASGNGNLCPDVKPIGSSPQIRILPGAEFLKQWSSLWTTTQAATGYGTPTEKGLLQARAALEHPPVGNTAVVLVTDGEPTCGSNEANIAAELLQKGIKTYVVGLPGASGAALLDSVAIAGGTAMQGCTRNCYISPSNPAAFQSALAQIASTTITTMTTRTIENCSFQLEPAPGADPNEVHLVVTDAQNMQQYEVPRPDGWTLGADERSAMLSPDLCERAKSGAFLDLTFQYGCVTAPVLPPR
ncbi:MAG TPA: vWA domain-containing protein [Polyangiaceae bacterium]|nr:vWA domain-containing protein [Polyangiaceae bacterium]